MRHPFTRSRSGLAGVAGLVLAMLLSSTLTSTTQGQEASGNPLPLARYVPKDNLVFYLEYDGLDAHAEAWKKTAAYKILNDTPTGAMLEAIASQVISKYVVTPEKKPLLNLSGAEQVTLIKHMARSGFLFANLGNPGDPEPPATVIVLRNAFKDKAIRPLVAKVIQFLDAPSGSRVAKFQPVVRAKHKVMSRVTPQGGALTWWVEDSKKEDLVLIFNKPERADAVLETLDGIRPNAVDHAQRTELVKEENGYVPTGLCFIDPRFLAVNSVRALQPLGAIKKLDFSWGFHEDALMTITRIGTEGPRTGLLALFDGPTFDKGKLPPIPEAATGFTVLSLDLNSTLERLAALLKTLPLPVPMNTIFDSLNAARVNSKTTFKGDLLAHLGPKVAWYILPNKAAANAAPMLPNMMSMMMASAGIDQIPRLAIVFDIDDPVAFGKVLDNAMATANRTLKSQAAAGAAGGAAVTPLSPRQTGIAPRAGLRSSSA